ncbi:type VII secretion protein EccB [Paractinoplanes durhamensis]|uniref:Type VII secretion protein EccB n=1 Tax=Paractinoplanes durhamensis TaxID=113563 RepID=A0ABQ3Z2Y2_9ACTN|nr:type VII secretion protein EccB [Actinoplanes durhamensis]GIE04181.1 type VII secretion protein EccB [Actinoplanes durhamensis]
MQSRRDQAHAQSYLFGRLTAGLVTGELDSAETPHRRTITGLVAGVLVAALVAGGFAVYGLFVPGGATSWRKSGTVVIEKETGTRYLYAQGRLRPVLNYASARLLLGDKLTVKSVAGGSLDGVPRGLPVGIVGAPDGLPTRGLGNTWWTACAAVGDGVTALTVQVGDSPTGTPLDADHALPVEADGDTYVIWDGHRYRLAEPWVSKVLGYDGTTVPVPAAWLDLMPAGPDLGPQEVPGRGAAGPPADGAPTRVGQLFTAGDDRYYVLLGDGLSRLTPTAYALLAGDPRTAQAYPDGVVTTTRISPAALARTPVSAQAARGADLPATIPSAVPPAGATWCVQNSPTEQTRLVAAGAAPALNVTRAGVGLTREARTADAVAVQPGLGGLAVAGRPDETPGSALYLVTDAGTKFPLAGAAVAKTLGYAPEAATVIAPDLLDLLPTGPLLDPDRVVG